jgi:hypothetical protein
MSPFSHGTSAIAATTCALVAFGLAAGGERQQGPPADLASVRTIAAEFRAVSVSGSPITDLSAGELTVMVAGRPRAIRSLDLVHDAGDEPTAADPAGPRIPPAPALPEPFATNARTGRGRTFYLLVDEASVTPGDFGPLQSAIGEFLTGLPPSDEVALASVRPGALHVPPATDRARVRGAFERLKDLGSADDRPASASARLAGCLVRLHELLGALRGSEQPPVVVVITTGLPDAPGAPDPATRGAGSRQTSGGGGARGQVAPPVVGRLRSAVANARAELYFVQLPGQIAGVTPRSAGDRSTDSARGTALEAIADDLGGVVLALRPADNVFLRVDRETRSHYVVSVNADADDQPGGASPIAIGTSRSGAVLRLRPDIFVGRATQAPTTTQEMLAGVDEFRQLPIRLAGFTSRADTRAGPALLITSVTEPVDSAVRFRSATTVLLDATGARVAEDAAGSTALSVTPLVSRFLAAPGHYVLRVAVVGADGRAGTVDCPIDARLTSAGALSLGSLRTGVARPLAPPGPNRGDSVPDLDPRLEFTSEAEAFAFFDLYGGTPNEHLTIVMEVLRRADGPPIQQLEPHILPARASEPGHYVVTAPVDLASLLPGDYVIRATVGVPGQTPAVITETLRKMRAGPTR